MAQVLNAEYGREVLPVGKPAFVKEEVKVELKEVAA
jgi:hypothetical protein